MPMNLDSLFYTYKQVGVVEKNGVKYKKLAKVPRIRAKHRAALAKALGYGLLAAVLGAAAFQGFRLYSERGVTPAANLF